MRSTKRSTTRRSSAPKKATTLLVAQLRERAEAAEKSLRGVERELKKIRRSYRSAAMAMKEANDDLALARRRESRLESEVSKLSPFESASELRKYLASAIWALGGVFIVEGATLEACEAATLTLEVDGTARIIRTTKERHDR